MGGNFLELFLRPQDLVFKIWKSLPFGSYKTRMDFDLFPRTHYAYCVWHAARQAELLGIDRISLVEFGVAGGNGLVELEKLALEVEKEFSIKIEIYGFDSGIGLPPPKDYRDLPYIWKEGFFHMDMEALNAQLSRSKLVIGDVAETVPRFFQDHPDAAPIGAIFSDLDYYSSTRDSLQLLAAPDEKILPRVYLYFDDIMSAELGGLMCNEVGQLKAIQEYNASSEHRVLAPIHGMRHTRKRPARWNEQIYIHHVFDHKNYSTYIHADSNRQLPLTNSGLTAEGAI